MKLKTRFPKTLLVLIKLLLSIGLFVLACTVIDRMEQKYAAKIDFSFNQSTSLSETSIDLVKQLPYDVKVYALFTPGREDESLKGLLERLSALSLRFQYSVENLARNPLLIRKISSSLEDGTVSSDCLILYCEKTGRTRVLDASDYISLSFDEQNGQYQPGTLRYEQSIAEALRYLVSDALPQIQILEGHDELGASDTKAMEGLLIENNYQLSRVNLLRGDSLSPEKLLMILSPRRDLLSRELDQLTAFIQSGGRVLITSDPDDPDSLPLFDSFLRILGFERKSGAVIAEESDKGGYYQTPYYLLPRLQNSEATTPLIAAKQDTLLMAGSRALKAVEGLNDKNTQVWEILKSGPAFLKDVHQGKENLIQEPEDEKRSFCLGLLSDCAQPNGQHSRAVLLGNASVLTNEWLYQNTFSASFLRALVHYLSPDHISELPITSKIAIRPSMVIPRPEIPIAVIILLPLTVILAAAFVLLPRRHK